MSGIISTNKQLQRSNLTVIEIVLIIDKLKNTAKRLVTEVEKDNLSILSSLTHLPENLADTISKSKLKHKRIHCLQLLIWNLIKDSKNLIL